MKPKQATPRKVVRTTVPPRALVSDLRELIQSARETVARGVNAALVALYWQIGRRIHHDILNSKRAEYGEEIVPTVSAQLAPEYGDGFSTRNLFRMVQFAEAFPDEKMDGDNPGLSLTLSDSL